MLETFTNGELFALIEPLKALTKIGDALPAKVGIRIARLVRLLHKEIEPIAEARNKLIIKYGEEGEEEGLFINRRSPQWQKFDTENNELMKETTKVEFEKVVLPDDARVAMDILVALEPFLAVADIPGVSSNGKAEGITQIAALSK